MKFQQVKQLVADIVQGMNHPLTQIEYGDDFIHALAEDLHSEVTSLSPDLLHRIAGRFGSDLHVRAEDSCEQYVRLYCTRRRYENSAKRYMRERVSWSNSRLDQFFAQILANQDYR